MKTWRDGVLEGGGNNGEEREGQSTDRKKIEKKGVVEKGRLLEEGKEIWGKEGKKERKFASWKVGANEKRSKRKNELNDAMYGRGYQ